MKIALVIPVLEVALVFAALVWASETERFIFFQNLPVEEFRSLGNDDHAADVTDLGTRISSIFIRVSQPPPNSTQVPILFSVWHTENTEIDSLSLEFSTYPNYVTVYLEAQQGGFPRIEFHQSTDARGVIYSVKDLGFYGIGTITMDFMMARFPQYTYPQDELQLTVEFSMHRTGFLQLTSLNVHTVAYITVPS
jgi:hypothetical protein